MERERARSALHLQLMDTIERGARAQEHSRLLVVLHAELDAQLRATVAHVRTQRARRSAARRSQSDK